MMILGYWDIRGMAYPIRLLLEYTETPYEDKHYVTGEAPDYDKSQWLDVKDMLGLDFPNLPYLIDGDVKLTQSNTILRYIARKHGLCGETESEKNNVSLLENEAMDIRMDLLRTVYSPQFETLKGPYLEKLSGTLGKFSRFLGDREWFASNKITFVDFVLYDTLDELKMLEPTCLQNFPNLQAFLDRFEAFPAIAAYLKAPRCMRTPVNNRMASWGNKK
ncbi:glutathione S-transferase Mu 5-like [Hyperolius riggenbachi]|uniref:glutathione S-transferase Mu 5-like n=1 Tax=Hyperolius riggenbachi TaxID=752182 RepID=UPI0035A3199F